MMISSIFMANAQQTVRQGDKIVGIGLGLGSYGRNLAFPPLSLSFDYAVKDRLFDNKSSATLGGYAGYYSYKTENVAGLNIYGWKYKNLLLGFRGALHYEFVRNLDTYIGAMLGYNFSSASYYSTNNYQTDTTKASANVFDLAAFLGVRYYFSPKFAVFGEFGYGISPARLGVTFKL